MILILIIYILFYIFYCKSFYGFFFNPLKTIQDSQDGGVECKNITMEAVRLEGLPDRPIA